MVAGSWDETDPALLSTANAFGAWLASRGYWIITGGGTGIAQACSEGATAAGGLAVAFHPTSRSSLIPKDDHHALTVFTGSGWDGRSLMAVKSCDVLVALGGHAGTLLEIVAAYLNAVPVIVLSESSDLVTRLNSLLISGAYLDQRRTSPLYVADSMSIVQSMIEALLRGEPLGAQID